MKKILLICFLVLSCHLLAQNQAANWYFGENAGVTFDIASGGVTSVNGGQLNTREGCTSISDENGNLILYTDGTTVYNRNHTVMQNGTGLFGDSSSTQSALVIPAPQNSDIYYIFTVDTSIGGDPDFGFNYSIVDMTLDGGLGGVTSKNINLLQDSSEKITAVRKSCDSDAIWVLTFASADGLTNAFNSFHAFEVTDTGVNTTAVVSTLPDLATDHRGQMKASPDGTVLAVANMSSGLYIYDFDSENGIVSNSQFLRIDSSTSNSRSPYGVEFSPNNRFLYVHASNDNNDQATWNIPSSHTSSLVQYDLESADIQASELLIDDRNLFRGSLQLGPNGKIYRSMSATYNQGLPFLSAINNPNELGAACNYENNAVNLNPNNSSQGLPPFIQSFFNDQIDIIQNNVSTTELLLCDGDVYTLSYDDLPDAIYTWYQDGSLLAESDHDLVVTESGTYELLIEFSNGSCDTFEGIAYVNYFDYPVANQPNDQNFCDDNNDGVWEFDLSTLNSDVLGGQDSTVYSVHYFENLTDAQNNENEIIGPYENTANPKEVFVRVHNIRNPNCYDITSFTIQVFNTPIANTVSDWKICDDADDGDPMNGQNDFDLSSIDSTVLGTQDPNDYTVTYHLSQNDADNNNAPLPVNYYNTTPFEVPVFVRIENNNYTDCYSTTSFKLIVNPIPETNNVTLFQCDEDGNPDGFTLFNLTEAHDDLVNNTSNRTTKFYLSQADALSDTDEIDGTSFNNTTNPQLVYVRVINDDTGCVNFAELLLDVTATDSNNAELIYCDDDGIEDGIYNFDLNEASPDILNELPVNLTINYYESYEDALLERDPLATNFSNNVPYSQTIYARVENANACYGISEVQLTVHRLPNIETEAEVIYCLNTFPETIRIDSGLINDAPSVYTYLWSTGATTESITINQAGTYTVTVTNSDNCEKIRTVTVLPSNIATIENIEVIDASSNNSITVIVSGEGDYEFALNEINGPYQDSPTFENVSPGLHTVYVRDKNDCGIVDDIVSVIGFPKFFTPNGDSYNDTWQVYGINTPSQHESIIYIFDRFGKLLKQLDPRSKGWDGTLNGKKLPTSDYWFQVTLQDGRIFKSHFTLKR